MTTGSITRGTTQDYPSGKNQGTWFRREWDGTNDPAHKAENGYYSVTMTQEVVQLTQPNPYYPFVPPTYYLNPSMASFQTAKDARASGNGSNDVKALSRLLSKIKGHSFNGAQAFAEVDKSANMLVDAVRHCVEAYKALKRRDYRGFSQELLSGFKGTSAERKELRRLLKWGDIPEIWLAAQYGWRPLVQDVLEAFNAFQNCRLKAMAGFHYKSSSKATPVTFDLSPLASGKHILSKMEEKVIYRLVLNENLKTATQLGLTPLGWAEVIWERIPFSFVLDWFIPIGNTLELYSFFGTLSFTMHRTRFKKYVWNVTGIEATTNPKAWTKGSNRGSCISMVREVGLSTAGIIFPSPKTLEKALGTEHLLNAAALIGVLIAGGKVSPTTGRAV